MKTKILLTYLMTVCTFISLAQDTRKSEKLQQTKLETFVSKTGVIIKFVDYKLPNLKLFLDGAETRIRQLSSGNTIGYFYQIEKSGQYTNSTASIEYSDLLEVIKALSTLKANADMDISSNPDYLENKFVTSDGFELGYYVNRNKIKWYLKLEKYGSDNTLFISDVETIEIAFQNAKSKIEELKNKP